MSKKEGTPHKRIATQWAILQEHTTLPGTYLVVLTSGIGNYAQACRAIKKFHAEGTLKPEVAAVSKVIYQPVVFKGPPLIATRETQVVVSLTTKETLKGEVE